MPPFEEGNTFGKGRIPGSRNKATEVFEAIGENGAADLLGMLQEKASNGSLRAAEILLARLWPRARASSRPVVIDLPPMETAKDIVQAHAALIALMAAGEVTPEQAVSISRLFENQRKALETLELETRIRELEAEFRGESKLPAMAA